MVLIVAVVAIFGTVAIVNSSKNGWEPSVKETKEPKTKKRHLLPRFPMKP